MRLTAKQTYSHYEPTSTIYRAPELSRADNPSGSAGGAAVPALSEIPLALSTAPSVRSHF